MYHEDHKDASSLLEQNRGIVLADRKGGVRGEWTMEAASREPRRLECSECDALQVGRVADWQWGDPHRRGFRPGKENGCCDFGGGWPSALRAWEK